MYVEHIVIIKYLLMRDLKTFYARKLLYGKKFLKISSFQVRAGAVKGQKQGSDEKTQELPYYRMVAPSSMASSAMHLHP